MRNCPSFIVYCIVDTDKLSSKKSSIESARVFQGLNLKYVTVLSGASMALAQLTESIVQDLTVAVRPSRNNLVIDAS